MSEIVCFLLLQNSNDHFTKFKWSYVSWALTSQYVGSLYGAAAINLVKKLIRLEYQYSHYSWLAEAQVDAFTNAHEYI